MGAYENPQRGIDKQFEVVRKEQANLWNNVSANLGRINQVEAKRARAQANNLNKYYNLYDKGMKGVMKDSNEILSNQSVSDEEAFSLSQKINAPFLEGKKQLRDLIESGADDFEIRNAIDSNIASARGYATSLALINESSAEYSSAVNKGVETDGRSTGSVLITGNNFSNTFDALNGIDVGNLKMIRNSSDPFDNSFWYDADNNGKLDAKTEIIDLKGIESSVIDGKFNVRTVPDDETLYPKVLTKEIRSALDGNDFRTTYQKPTEDGKTMVNGYYRNENAQKEAFMTNDEGIGLTAADAIRSVEGGVAAYFQKEFGANALASAMESDMSEDEMLFKVKEKMYQTRIEPNLAQGTTKLKKGKSTRNSYTVFEDETSDKAVRSLTKEIKSRFDDVLTSSTLGPTGDAQNNLTSVLRGEKINNQPIVDVIFGNLEFKGVDTYELDKSNPSIYTLIDKNGKPLQTVDLSDDDSYRNLEKTITKNHFRKGRNTQAVDYLYENGLDAELPNKSKVTTSSSSAEEEVIINQDVDAAGDQDFSESDKFNPNYDIQDKAKNPWNQDTDFNEIYNQPDEVIVEQANNDGQIINTSNVDNYSNAAIDNNGVVNFDFNGLSVNKDKFKSPPIETSTFGVQSYIGNMFNKESSFGDENGNGLTNYGFTGKRFRQNGMQPPSTPKEALALVNKEIIGSPNVKTKEYNTAGVGRRPSMKSEPSILYELNHIGKGLKVSKKEWEGLEKTNPELAEILVDYKFNTGRNITDLIAIASGKDIWNGDEAASKNLDVKKLAAVIPKKESLVKYLQSIPFSKLKEAREELYTKGNKFSQTAWDNSQKYRI